MKHLRGPSAHAFVYVLGGIAIAIILLNWWFDWGIPMGHGARFGYR